MIQLTVTRLAYRSLQQIETFDGFHQFFLFVIQRTDPGISYSAWPPPNTKLCGRNLRSQKKHPSWLLLPCPLSPFFVSWSSRGPG